MTKRMGWWSQVTQLGLSQALQDERCSFKGGVVVWDGLGRASGHPGVVGMETTPGALETEGSRSRRHRQSVA